MSDSDDDTAYNPSPVRPHPPSDPFGWGRLPPRGGGGLGSGGDDDEEEHINVYILGCIHKRLLVRIRRLLLRHRSGGGLKSGKIDLTFRKGSVINQR
jgi:hypothetical protein